MLRHREATARSLTQSVDLIICHFLVGSQKVNRTLTTITLAFANQSLTKMTKVLTKSQPIRLKGRSFLALVLSPELPLDDWLQRLDDLAARSAGFFLRRPIVLDVEGLEIGRAELKAFIDELAKRNVRVIGMEGARSSLIGIDMPPALSDGRPVSDFEEPETVSFEPSLGVGTDAPAQQKPQARSIPSLIIDQPVRSGQSVIFPEGDVTIIASVASGAEVIAGGSIHVYGALRGRALAGSMGNSSARIFCSKLEAELLAIDGLYKTAEDIEPQLRGRSVHLWLEGDAIRINTLN